MFKFKSAKSNMNASSSSSSSASASTSSCSWCPLYKNFVCLLVGLIIGIRFTDIWYNVQNLTISESKATTELFLTETVNNSKMNQDMLPQFLYNTTRVLCWIMTNPENHLTKAIHIRHTWGKRCNKLLFMSTEEDEVLQTVKLSVEEGRQNLWNKTKEAFKYIYDHHFDDAEWFLKADDDTYIIMENLRLLLYQYPAESPIYFGAKFKRFVKQGYMSGGAGYVLSKESLKKFSLEGYDNSHNCPETYLAEDVQLGLCLQNIGVIAGDSRDEEDAERFLPLSPEYIIPEDKTWWYKNYSYYPQNENVTCCSSKAISFHYIKPDQFYILDYLLYILRPFGIFATSNYSLPQKLNLEDVSANELKYFRPLSAPPLDIS